MVVQVPSKLRVALYVLTVLGTPAIAYANAKGYIGATEVSLWSAEVAAVSAIAAFKATDLREVDSE
jgi:hypothetical protein